MSNHHYFASTAVAWATAPTRAEAIAKVARTSGADFIKRNVAAHGGLYVWSCRVLAPEAQHYSINNYAPEFLLDGENNTGVAVPIERAQAHNIVNTNGHVVPSD